MREDISTAIIDSMSDGLVVIDSKGAVTHMNPSALKILGFTAEESRSPNYSELFIEHPENDAFNDILFEGLQRGRARGYGEVKFRGRDGRLIDLAVTTSFLKSGSPNNHSIVVLFKDITELKDLDRARSRVLSHLSHELTTPLSIVMACVDKLATPENNSFIARIKRNLDRLLQIQIDVGDIVRGKPLESSCSLAPWVEQALDLVELAGEEYPDHKPALDLIRNKIERDFTFEGSGVSPVSLAETIRKSLQALPETASARRLAYETRISKDDTPVMDPAMLEKIVNGLIRNAIENTPDGGRIILEISRRERETHLVVADTGIGITEASVKHIFGGFFHAVDTDMYSTKKPYQFGAGGKGLDLMRTRIYAEMFGFSVHCRSTRCMHIPAETDTCPGDIDLCPYVRSAGECAASGGTEFSLIFPASMPREV
ncbi:MAG TPA: PAS domain S-box protein [Desulfobacteraceae bacterium]|nr:PAS domain S-box protein [Desulfobacteraceae bacterium]